VRPVGRLLPFVLVVLGACAAEHKRVPGPTASPSADRAPSDAAPVATDDSVIAVMSSTDPTECVARGDAFFKEGLYLKASECYRQGVLRMDAKAPFSPDPSSRFPSRKGFEKALRDLKRYVTESPRDPAGLSVVGYMYFAEGDDEHAREVFGYLKRLPKHEDDPFAAFFIQQLDRRVAARGLAGEIAPQSSTDPGKPGK
jgi:hypothetical protein